MGGARHDRGARQWQAAEIERAAIVTQLAAARGALDRVGFKLMAAALAVPRDDEELRELEELFLKLT